MNLIQLKRLRTIREQRAKRHSALKAKTLEDKYTALLEVNSSLFKQVVELEKQLDSTPSTDMFTRYARMQSKYEQLNASLPKLKADAIRECIKSAREYDLIYKAGNEEYIFLIIAEDYADNIERGEK